MQYLQHARVTVSERKFCDGLEMKFTSPLGGIQ